MLAILYVYMCFSLSVFSKLINPIQFGFAFPFIPPPLSFYSVSIFLFLYKDL